MRFDPKKPRDVVVAAGRSRLLSHPLDGLRSQLNASTLAGVSPVSRDTAYRVFRDGRRHSNVTDAIVAAVSEAANDPAWTGYHEAIRDALVAYQSEPHDDSDDGDRDGDNDSDHDSDGDDCDGSEAAARAAVVAALQANFEAQFRSPGLPVAWLLQAAALTSSPAWEGEAPAEKEDLALGREILEQRRVFYRGINQQLVGFLAIVLSAQGRRTRPGVEPEHVVMLLHALLDGAVLRNLIEPGALPSGMVAEAMYALAEAMTEEGAHVDPRRPIEDRQVGIFDRMLEAAEELWSTQPDITVEDAAARAGVPVEAGCLLFPTVGDLADSLLRARVVGCGFTDIGPLPDDVEVNQRLVGLVTELRSLRDFAEECPHAVAVTRTEPPKESAPFVEDFVDNESRIVAALGASRHPAQLLRDLIGFASQGRAAWPSVVALLRTLGYQDD